MLLPAILLVSCGGGESSRQTPVSTNFDLVGDVREPSLNSEQADQFDYINENQDFPGILLADSLADSLADFPDSDFLPDESDNATAQRDRIPASVPVLANMPGSSFSAITGFVSNTVGSTLLDLNERLYGGEQLSEQERSCFYGYEAALGEPLLALACEVPLRLAGNSVQIDEAGFANTQACVNSLLQRNIVDCGVALASLTVVSVDPQSSDQVSDSTQNAEPQELLNEGILIVEIRYGGVDGTLDLVFRELGVYDDLVCSYELDTGVVLDSELAESCLVRSEQLVAIIGDLAT